jgi:hypothetical protein
MSRAYVFLVHGVGRHETGDGDFAAWAKPWRDGIIAELQRYAPYDDKTADEIIANDICFRPVSYDAVFEEDFRQVWGNLAGALADNPIVGANPKLKSAIQSVADNESAEDIEAFFWENVLDALLWYSLGLAHSAVKVRVAKQLVEGVKAMVDENNGDTSKAHIVAHSLGTSVAHDTVVSLTHETALHEGVLDPANFSWNSVTMVANVSRLLEGAVDISPGASEADFQAHNSILKPGANSAVDNFLNVRHQIDPITWPRMFDPDWDENYKGYMIDRFSDPKKVHDFEHYVKAPRFHRRLLRTILEDQTLGDAHEREAAKAAYQADHPLSVDDVYQDLKNSIAGNDLDAKQIVKYLIRAYKELKQ